jgi:hypothetical protein
MQRVEVRRQRVATPTGALELEEAVSREWVFEDADREAILAVVKDLPGYMEISAEDSLTKSVRVATFVEKIEMTCTEAKDLAEQPTRADMREARRRVLKRCRAALKELRRIAQGRGDYIYLSIMDPIDGEGDPDGELGDQVFYAAREAFSPLLNFVEVMEKAHQADIRLAHRAPADSDRFVRRLASIYREHIGEPSSYAGGAFYALVKEVLRILGVPSKDPSRRIRAALARPF